MLLRESDGMDAASIVLIAFGLAMDAFAVSIARGLASRGSRRNVALKMAVSFGLFQALMPVLGWALGFNLKGLISGVDHWFAFALLGIIGGKMMFESTKAKSNEERVSRLTLVSLLVLSVATSIDALAVGLGFAFLNISIVAPVLVIGTVTFSLSLIGGLVGSELFRRFENRVQIVGGLILIGIGLKLLIEHSFFA